MRHFLTSFVLTFILLVPGPSNSAPEVPIPLKASTDCNPFVCENECRAEGFEFGQCCTPKLCQCCNHGGCWICL